LASGHAGRGGKTGNYIDINSKQAALKKYTMNVNKIIGEKIKSLREMKNLSIEEIAERSGLSILQINRIEQDEEFPSLAPLIKIARVLGVRLGTFLDDQQELGPVICRKKNIEDVEGISFSNNAKTVHKNMSYYALSQDKSGRHMEPFLISVRPAEKADFVPSSHEGEEFIFVMEGIIEINYGKDTYILEEGDSIYYDSIVAHHVHAGNEYPARILGVVYTPY
jgi:transcriptional regulator with XRE-family HTH domain